MALLRTLTSASCFILLIATACVGQSYSDGQGEEEEELLASIDPTVCIIVRTSWIHGDNYGSGSLRYLLAALQAQQYVRWEALLITLDDRPFPDLRHIVRSFNDERIWVQAELVGFDYTPKTENSQGGMTWTPQYHNRLYNLTDKAIRACPPTTEWVVVTHGDSSYDPHFLEHVVAAPPDADAVAVDYYSRFQRPTGPPCERLADHPGLPSCKVNEFRFCQTDISANAYRWGRLVEEDRRFGVVDPDGGSWGANDGMLSQILLMDGWKLHHVSRCLVDHAPSPQQCALRGGVWDDSRMCTENAFGGECVDSATASKITSDEGDDVETLTLPMAYDPDSFHYGTHITEGLLTLTCIRERDPARWVQDQVFGRVCAAAVDRPHLTPDLPSHPWDHWGGDLEYAPSDADYPPEAMRDEL